MVVMSEVSFSASTTNRELSPVSSKRKARSLLAVALLLPLGLLHVRSPITHITTSQKKALELGTEAPPYHAIGSNNNDDDKALKKRSRFVQPSNKDTEFDYTAYWERVTDAAYQSLAAEEKKEPTPCPKVYVYDLPSKLRDETDKSTTFGGMVEKEGVFHGYLHKTHQYSFPSILEKRLRSSKQCRTLDPNEAELFFAPVFPASKSIEEYIESCKGVTGEAVRDGLPHLNSTNACRHFFVVGKGHVDVQHCEGWFSNPIPELKPFSRLAYSNYSFVLDSHGAHRYDKNDTTSSVYPNLASVPYPSSLHFQSKKELPHLTPKYNARKRNVLMSFVGKYNHGDIEVRERIHDLCLEYNNTKVCEFLPKYFAQKMPKAKATFCLEPAGDTPGRKSLSDSITFGCIPVLFSELTDDVAPWFWLDWKDRGRVLVPREDFVAGRIDLKKLLQSIPKDLLKLMQSTLAEKVRRFQYSLDDDQDDGVRIILDNLHREALEKESRGVCGY